MTPPTHASSHAVDLTSLSRRSLSAWTSAATWGADGIPATIGSESAAFTVPADAVWHGLTAPLVVGSDLSAHVTVAGPNAHGVFLRTASETILCWSYGPTGNCHYAQAIQKPNGVTVSAPPVFTWPGLADHKSWQGGRLIWSIRCYGPRDVGVLVNGREVQRFTLAGDVEEAGFAIYGNAASTGSIQYASRQTWALPTMRLLIIGDSLSEPGETREWASFAAARLSQNYDLTIDNRAVSGNRSDQQLSALQGAGVSGATHATILLGTNNQRQGTSVTDFHRDLGDIIDILQAASVKTVLGVYHPYFTVGVPSVATTAGVRPETRPNDYAEGAPYRAAALHVAGLKGVRVFDVGKALCPITADRFLAEAEPVCDGVHLTAASRKIAGEGFAAALMALDI